MCLSNLNLAEVDEPEAVDLTPPIEFITCADCKKGRHELCPRTYSNARCECVCNEEIEYEEGQEAEEV